MLETAPAAAREVRARGVATIGRRLLDGLDDAASEA
jgi:hypothetical protein